MGTGMASRLLSTSVAGTPTRPLVLYNRTPSKCTDLQTAFPDSTIIIKQTAREVVESTSICYSMLSTPEAAQLVFNGPDGVLAGVVSSDDKAIIDCATLAESDMKTMSEAVTKAGGRFLEAPVSGSKAPAANGSLIFLCAGDKSLFEEVVGDGSLNAMGKANHFLSEQVGFGTRAKLVVNSLMGTMVAAYSESLTLTEKVGLDPSTMIQIISEGAITSPVYGLKGPKMVVGDHSPNFPLKHAHKDMDLAVKMAEEAGVDFKVNGRAEEVFRSAREDEDLDVSDKDFSAVVEKIRKGSDGIEERKK